LKFLLFLVCIFWSGSTSGQLNHPEASPLAKIEQEIGLSKISIEYFRPAVTGRVIFGNDSDGFPGLVPYNLIWRVGANEVTKIIFDTDVSVLGNILPKGSYALYAFPSEREWQIVFHKNTTHWGDGRTAYDASEDALRITVTPAKVLAFQENFSISFDGITHDSVAMIWHWAHTKITLPIAVDTQSVMEVQIQEKLQNTPTAQTYYEIARYYQEQGIKTATFLDHVNKALELCGETYYFYRIKSLLQAELGRYEDAILSATKSMNMSETEGKDEFVRMNQRMIGIWKKNRKV